MSARISAGSVRVHILTNSGKAESHIVQFATGEAFVIDCGGDGALTARYLRELSPARTTLVLTHLHSDHCSGVANLLQEKKPLVDVLYLKHDDKLRRSEDPERSRVVPELMMLIKNRVSAGALAKPRELMLLEGTSRVLYREDPEVTLSLIFPDHYETVVATMAGDANQGGAILKLSVGPKSMIFGDDVPFPVWKKLSETMDLQCDVFLIPHHGAPQSMLEEFGPAELAARTRPKFAFVSVGTGNTFNHPDEDTIKAFRKAGAYVGCTQVTGKCHPGSAAPGTDVIARRSSELGPPGINCFGSIALEITAGNIRILRKDVHESAINRILPRRLCK